ncbi:MAG: tRNA (adenosine(37)-N6)-threonylcarbamoyltransferase complex transferase subunit TsaD [Treponema sp.]|jgi:N6-L-threonylcarbamoyladenine synthase|nr:tRNA (adenosine(37)-N6)-threonylcarbamoyltransferase complex transferase subunit TsaD [Treponema sp.]
MKVLGIESSCDECAASVVVDGKTVLSNVVATQIPFHAAYSGVVPEIASRKHTEWIQAVARETLEKAKIGVDEVDAVAATSRPGLLGSLLVGLTFAKAFAWARGLPFIAVDHMLAHLYASRLELQGISAPPPEYPFLGLLVSGGHSIICRVDAFDEISVLGTTIDDAVGEAFDKVSKYYGFGYPGGAVIDKLARSGDAKAFRFPLPNLYKKTADGGSRRYDVSYSGLKNAVINQLEQFRALPCPPDEETEKANIAASFQKSAIETLLRSLFNAVEDTGLYTIVAGGGVAANSLLRSSLAEKTVNGQKLRCLFPPAELCGDNGAMVAGIAYQYLARGETSSFTENASARVWAFKRR